MKRAILSLCLIVAIATGTYAQNFVDTFVDTFDANSLGWTEMTIENEKGTVMIDKGTLTLKSKKDDGFLDTFCYAPLDVKKPFVVTANVRINKLDGDRVCGLVFNYKDGGNFYSFNFNDDLVNFTRYVDNEKVGQIRKTIKWSKKKKLEQEWKLVYDGDVLSFYVDDMEILKVRYMPLDFSGIGFYTFGKQTLVVEDMTFTQN